MTILGKKIRLERILNRNTGRTVIVPMDHGISVGPIAGLIDMKTAIQKVAEGGANAIVEHKGLVAEGHRRQGRDVGLIIHMSASTSLAVQPHAKCLVCSVEEAIRLGADGVSIHVNLGNGEGFTVLEVIRMVEEVTGKAPSSRKAPRRAGDPAILVASSRRAVERLGWAPRFPSLNAIVRTAWDWLSSWRGL